ncbi:DUF1304 domain-containing protein [Corynebacterium sp. zg-331]|uniref:DUF1304 domain-containing protein n=1 Tax=unclassified Corynebacterium TaxID=2624378 RepID=UPI00128D61F4|nr:MULTISPECIES: DUF1304 domain-containing protein [unclassified Corynebacterium]MBC3185663.1 DUF1304 domain-containing protein [Corynebacterium sp. zg-331]MPV52157.1 DUF1304 family protein [Corynebacterium sp. zg331]
MLAIGFAFALLAALLHVFIFYLESFAWESERARALFGTTPETARLTKFNAYNQGFYNFFLAALVVAGLVALPWSHTVGITLALAGVAPMLAAAIVLFASSPAHRQAALKQGTLPLLAALFLVIAAW